jgi:hypothetical protein
LRAPNRVVTLIDGSTLEIWDWIPNYGRVVRGNGVTIAINLMGTARCYDDAMPPKRPTLSRTMIENEIRRQERLLPRKSMSSNGEAQPELVAALLAALAESVAKLADQVRRS